MAHFRPAATSSCQLSNTGTENARIHIRYITYIRLT